MTPHQRSKMTDAQFLAKAFNFAAQVHTDHRRKGPKKEPYINHPVKVAEIIARHEATVDMIAAALLHDAVEDTKDVPAKTMLWCIQKEFGCAVSMLVEELSVDKTLTKKQRKAAELAHAEDLSIGAKRLKIADQIATLEDLLVAPPKNWTEKRVQEYFIWTKKIVDKCSGHDRSLEREFDVLYQRGVHKFKITA